MDERLLRCDVCAVIGPDPACPACRGSHWMWTSPNGRQRQVYLTGLRLAAMEETPLQPLINLVDPGRTVFPFGKHRGRTVGAIIDYDPRYTDWLINQPWAEVKYPALHAALRFHAMATRGEWPFDQWDTTNGR